MAGAATADAVRPRPALLRNSRRFMVSPVLSPWRRRLAIVGRSRSRSRARADHEAVEAVFGDLPPQILIGTEGHDGVVDRLEVGIGGGGFRVKLVGCPERRFHHGLRKRTQ